ncbi:MAG: CotH kinase family protein [Verrucomicrobia bacterium]|nr:CotH kinase family protein [Verrucomicrobiota bacterium]
MSGLGGPILSEFLAANRSVLADEDGLFADWIEIHNPEDVPLALAGYHLTDNAANLTKWTFPAVTLAPGEYLVVFASGKNRLDPAAPLHTNFQLAADGEYLALVAPDGATVLSAFTPVYPPQFENASYGLDTEGASPAWSYFATPTPGRPNGRGLRAGPILQPLEPHPPQPVQGPLTVAVRGLPVNGPVAAVELHYRRMFAAEAMLSMRDDGTGGDARAGDGVWTAVIPEEAFGPAEMTRWRFVATDDDGAETRNPPFRAPLDSPQYFGTVAHDDRIQTLLPVLHWFTSNPAGAGTSTGSRGAVYYEGEFYDNVLFTLHGQSSAGFPKKSYNLDFNRPQRFRWSPTAPRVADIDLLTNWADKSKVRHVLAYEVMREAGVPAHFAFTVRVQQNGRFFSTADLVEDADEIYLERAGLNPDGALYKVYDNLLSKAAGNTATSGVEKKTRRWESNSDLQALINGLAQSGPALERYLYDHIDLPRCVNLLAVNSVIRNIDMHSKNWYVYRDTGRSDEWAILPWDLDLSHGRVWNTQNTYFDNALYTDGYVVNSTSIRLVSLMFANPAMRAMILRRIRTLSDRFLQPLPAPGTPETALYYERRLNEQSALIDPPSIVPSDARLDFEKWGFLAAGGHHGAVHELASGRGDHGRGHPALEDRVSAWPTPVHLQHAGGRPRRRDPLPQTDPGPLTNYAAFVTAGAPVQVLVPTTGTLGTTWTGDPAFEPFDTAGWRNGTTGVGYERATGYESLIGTDVNDAMRNNNSVYLRIRFEVSDPAAFQRLQLRMKFDDGFVAFLNGTRVAAANAPTPLQWNSAATISREANPAAYTLYDVSEGLSALRSGPNVLAIQGLNDNVDSSDMIIVPELYGGKVLPPTTREPKLEFGTIEFSPTSGNQDEEFIQVRNPHSLAVDVSGWRLTGAVEHTFLGGTVLPAEGTIYVCPNAAAFRARRVSPKGGEGCSCRVGTRAASQAGEAR